MEAVIVRTATIADAQVVAALNEHVHRLHVNSLPSFFKNPSLREATFIFERLLAQDNAHALIAYRGEQPVGYTLAFIQLRGETPFTYPRRFLYLDQISVHTQMHGNGIGTRLVQEMLQVARDHSIEEVDVNVWYFNQIGQRFFESFGFTSQMTRLSLRLDP